MSEEKKEPRISFSKSVLIGVGAGVALGLLIGEYAGRLKIVGDVYIGLLQMTVLPYVFVSLIGNVAKLSLAGGKQFIRWAALVLGILSAIGLVVLPLLALCFPTWHVGSFFSTSTLEQTPEFDFQRLYIPSNPFHSLASNLVPAVALFSILAGAAAIGMPRKERLIELLDLTTDLLTRLNRMVVKLTPFGVFGIAASASGTLSGGEFGLLQGYLIAHALGVLLLTFGVLPILVSGLTPLHYREVLRAAKEPLLTALVTGSTFVTLPMIVDNAKTLLKAKGLDRSEVSPEVVVPLAYPFPDLGKLLSLIFIPFAAWFYGSSMTLADYPNFLVTGLFGSFGSLVVTIPMLLDQQQIPADIFQLFLLSGVVAARVGDMLGSMHLLVFALLTTCGVAGVWQVRTRQLLVGLGLVLAAGACLVGATRVYLTAAFVEDYEKQDLIGAMETVESQADFVLLEDAAPNPVPLKNGQSRLERIRERGVIRIGTNLDNLPFAFMNGAGDLVGFDVDMAHRLALDLNVRLELVPVELNRMQEQLDADHFDLVMAGIEQTLGRTETMSLSQPYMQVTSVAVVLDHRADEFETLETANQIEGLRVAVTVNSYASEAVLRRVPDAEVVQLSSAREFFEGDAEFDALAISAEAGSAWTLRYPRYMVVNPLGRKIRVPLVYPVGGKNDELLVFLNHWLDLRRGAGQIDRLYDYWILGKGVGGDQPRWSVLRDVLGWVD